MRNLAILLAFACLCCGCQTSRSLKLAIPVSQAIGFQDERTERIGEVVRKTMRKENMPGISIAVIEHGQIVWAQGFGWRDVSRRLPVDTDTQFQAGSISKPVTALGVLMLSASGKVRLDEDVNTYLKGWHLDSKFTNQPITLRQLLCHRAGMVPHGFVGYDERAEVPSLVQVLNRHETVLGWLTGNKLGSIKVIKPPGSGFLYSGGGYCVVQRAVEDVTGESFEAAMDRLVLQPTGMSRSTFQQPPLDTNNIALGYGWMKSVLGGGRWRVFPEKAPAGLWATPRDLARFAIAVQQAASGKATAGISPAIAEEFLKPQFDGWQGIGIRLGGSGENRVFYHAGETLDYFARFDASVSNGRGLALMTNARKERFGPIVKAITDEFGWSHDR